MSVGISTSIAPMAYALRIVLLYLTVMLECCIWLP